MSNAGILGASTVVTMILVVLAVGLSTLYAMRASYMPLVLRSSSLVLLSVLILVIPPAIEIFTLEANGVDSVGGCMAARIAATASYGVLATAVFLRTMRLAGMHAVQIAIKGLKKELRSSSRAQAHSGSGSRSSTTQAAAETAATNQNSAVTGSSMLMTLAADASEAGAAGAAVAPAETHQTLLAGALNNLKSSSSEAQLATAAGFQASEVSSRSNTASRHRSKQKQLLLSRVRRLRWWTGPRVQAAFAAASTCIWVAIPLAIDVLTTASSSSSSSSQQQVCVALPLQTWAGLWPSMALMVGGTLAVLFSLRSINESVSLRLELIIVAIACVIGAIFQTIHTAAPDSLSLEAASAVMLGLGITATLAWPLYLSFSKRFSIVNSKIDADKIANLLASSSGSATATSRGNNDPLGARTRSGASALTLLDSSGSHTACNMEDWVLALDHATPGQILAILTDRNSDFLASVVSVTHNDLLALASLEAAGRVAYAEAEYAASVERFVHPGAPPKPLPSFLHSTSTSIGHLMDTGTLLTAADEEAGLLVGASGRRRGVSPHSGSQLSIVSSARSRRRSGQGFANSLSMSPGAAASRQAADSKASRQQRGGRDSASVATLELATAATAATAGRGRRNKTAIPILLDVPTLPEALSKLQMSVCIAHPQAYEQFQLFVESELASENLLFLEAVFLFKLGVITSMVRAGVCYDVDSASLKPLRDSHRATLLSEVRTLIGHRIFVGGAILTLEWLSQIIQSDEAWASIIKTRSRRQQGEIEAPTDMVFGPAADPSFPVLHADKPLNIDAASPMSSHTPIEGGSDPASPATAATPDVKVASSVTGKDDIHSGTVRGTITAPDDKPTSAAASEADRYDAGTATPTSRLADVTIDEVEALISDGVADISEQFIHRDAVMEINISSRTRTACLSTVTSSPLATGPYTFDNPARTVRSTLKRDTFPRFLRSPVVSVWFARRPWEQVIESSLQDSDFE